MLIVKRAITFNPLATGSVMLLGAALTVLGQPEDPVASEEGIALVIVYDTSGSMNDTVPDGRGKDAPIDVNVNEFARVKKLEATVVGAADESPLNTQPTFILEEKILLEVEDPAAGRKKP